MPAAAEIHASPQKHKKTDVNMTVGNIPRHLISFALPLLIGNLFQQMYNTVDTWVVGNFVSNEAFSAVGTVGPITSMLIGFFTGLATGAGVVISQYYGAGDESKVHDSVHTSMFMTFVLGILFTAVGVLGTPTMLHFMNTPADVYPESYTYLTIYFAGISGLMIYNMGAGILRAVGDSRRPFYFLVLTAVVNTVLDLLFVIVFHMGVMGVALATIIAQFISAVLIMVTIMRSPSCIRFTFLHLRLDLPIFRMIMLIGIPTAVHLALVSFSNIFVQSYINYFGSECMGGWTAYTKVDQILLLPAQALAMACTTFVGQNLGNQDMPRAKRGVKDSVLLGLVCTIVLSILVSWQAPVLVGFFNDDPEVIRYGTLFLRYISLFYFLPGINQTLSSAQRGAGNSVVPMYISLFSFIVFRQIYLFVLTHYITNTILPVAMGYPAGWVVYSIISTIYYAKVGLGHGTLVNPARQES